MNYETKSGFYPTAITGDNTFDAQLNIVDPMQIAETKPGITPGMVFSETQGWIPQYTASNVGVFTPSPYLFNDVPTNFQPTQIGAVPNIFNTTPIAETKPGITPGMVFSETNGWIPENSASVVGGLMPSPSINIQPEYVNTQTNIPSVEYSPRQIYTYNNQLTQQANSGMTLNELTRLLDDQAQTGFTGQATPISYDQIIAAIQSQYQPMQAMPMPEATQGAQRFVTNAGNFGPIEQIVEYGRSPVTQSEMTTFVPGVFDINRTSYIPTPSAAQIEARLSGDSSGSSGVTPLSPSQEAFFNFLDSPEGQSFKDARGAAMSNVIGASLGLFGPGLIAPAASLYNYMTGKPGIGKSISGLIDADKAAAQAATNALINYGVTSTARGPTTAAQAQALANQLANQLSYALASGSGSGYGTTGHGSASGIGVGSTQGINSMDAMSDSVSSPSGGYSTASGIGVGSTEGINAMDAMSDAASSSSPSSSKIVCTAMNESYGFGSFRNKIWLKYAADNLTKAHEVGYHTLFLPLVDLAYKKDVKPVRIVLENIARHRSADLRAEMRGTKRDNVGRVYRAILEPICYFVGKLKGY